MQNIAIIDNARETWANGFIAMGLILIVITFLSVVRPAFFNEIQKPVIKLFLSAVISVIATISIALIYCYILYQSKLDSVDFMIGLAIMIFVAVTDNYLIDYVIIRDSQDTAKHNDGCSKRKRIKI